MRDEMNVDVDTRAERGAAGGPFTGYAEPEERPPFISYAGVAGVFTAVVGAALIAARRSGRELPPEVNTRDLVLIGTASHKLSRLISKDKVTSFLRAPFTEYQGSGGPSELEESPRGHGARKAVGELIACPYCVGLWVAAALHVGLIFSPRFTRFAASTFAALTISDFLQIGYKAAEDRGLGGG
jgi:Protein of unknown function (DUF1360)